MHTCVKDGNDWFCHKITSVFYCHEDETWKASTIKGDFTISVEEMHAIKEGNFTHIKEV